jgi:hypothetical protein
MHAMTAVLSHVDPDKPDRLYHDWLLAEKWHGKAPWTVVLGPW